MKNPTDLSHAIQICRQVPNRKMKPMINGLRDKILKSVKELPPMPQVVIKTKELIADPNSDAKKIAEVIETDQAIATKVLKVANSSYFGMSGKISSISHASVVLGHKILGEIVTLAGSRRNFRREIEGIRI